MGDEWSIYYKVYGVKLDFKAKSSLYVHLKVFLNVEHDFE